MPKECNSTDAETIFSVIGNSHGTIPGLSTELNFLTYENIKEIVSTKRPAFFWVYFGLIGAFTLLTILLTIISQYKKAGKESGIKIINLPLQNDKNKIFKKVFDTNHKKSGNLHENKNVSAEQDELKKTALLSETNNTSTLKLPQKNYQPVQGSKTVFEQILQAYDFIERVPTLIVSKRPTPESAAFDIIRVLSMCWVVLAHQFSERITNNASISVLQNIIDNGKHSWNTTLIQHGWYAVDFFLFMGGYVAILSLQRIVHEFKSSSKWKWPVLYVFLLVKRYVRILPIMAVIILFQRYCLAWLSPETPTNQWFTDDAFMSPEITWRDWSLVYAYGKKNSLFVGWFWYLVIDYQCFMIVPLILMVNWYHKYAAFSICTGLISTSVIYTLTIDGLSMDAMNPIFNDEYYFYLPCRMCVYFAGCAVAVLSINSSQKKPTQLQQTKKEPTTPKVS